MRNDWQSKLRLPIHLMRSPDILDLTPAERAGLVWLLMAQWEAEDGYLPADEDFIRKASMLGTEWGISKNQIKPLFVLEGNGLCYPPVRKEWERVRAIREANADGARISNAQRSASSERAVSASAAGAERDASESSLPLKKNICGSVDYRSQKQCNTRDQTQKASPKKKSSESRETPNKSEAIEKLAAPFSELEAKLEEGEMSAQSALKSEILPRPARESVGVFDEHPLGLGRGATIRSEGEVVWPSDIAFREVSPAQDEIEGTEVRPNLQQEQDGPASEPEMLVSDDGDSDADFIAAKQAQATVAPRRAGLGVKPRW